MSLESAVEDLYGDAIDDIVGLKTFQKMMLTYVDDPEAGTGWSIMGPLFEATDLENAKTLAEQILLNHGGMAVSAWLDTGQMTAWAVVAIGDNV